jgi:Uma2 family endonuclease
VLREDQRIELLEGVIVQMTPMGPKHCGLTETLLLALQRLLPAGWYVRSERPISISGSEPQPDACLVRGRPRDFLERHPSVAELGLAAEVSDSTLASDRKLKARIYAAAGIPEYWIVNLVDRQVEVYTDPRPAHGEEPPAYAGKKVYSAADRVPVSLLGQPLGDLAAAEFLP